MQVEVIRSRKRRKTIQAKLKNDVLEIRIPARMSKREENKAVAEMMKKMKSRLEKEKLNRKTVLMDRAQRLNLKYFNGRLKIKSVEFVTNQNSCFGSCSTRSARIRISHRLANAPKWVLDYVIFHEMAHILQPNHSKKFHELENIFPHAERARGYLIALSLMGDDTDYKDTR